MSTGRRFPSDTISTHILWPHGAELLARWGLLDELAATGLPPICRQMSFDVGPFALRGTVPDANDGRGGFCPRRTVLDSLLVNAAAESGVEVREAFTVDELLFDGDTVVGIRGHQRDGRPVEERARIVIGADGVHSFVARAVRAPEYDPRPVAACGYYSYFSGVPQDDIELYVRDHCAFGGAPTNDGLHLVMVNWPRQGISRGASRHRGPCLAGARAVARLCGAGAQRQARGEVVRHGRRSELLPEAVRRGLGARRRRELQPRSDHGAGHQRRVHRGRDARRGDRCRLVRRRRVSTSCSPRTNRRETSAFGRCTSSPELAALEPPPPHMQALFGALRGNQDATNAFLSAITGAIPLR